MVLDEIRDEDLPLARRALEPDTRAERHEQCRRVARVVGVAQDAADGGLVADARAGDLCEALRDARPRRLADIPRHLHLSVGHHRAQPQLVADRDPNEPSDAGQVYECLRTDQAVGDKDPGKSPARHHRRAIPQSSLERGRFLNGRRRVPLRLLHRPAPPRSPSSPWAASRQRSSWLLRCGFAARRD